MIQRVEMSNQERVDMYKKFKKDMLIEMLIEANRVIEKLCDSPKYVVNSYDEYCRCYMSNSTLINGRYICNTCNKPYKF